MLTIKVISGSKTCIHDETWPQLLSDLDQLREIMKITGTPAADFVVKLQSQDVSHIAAKPPKHNTDEAQWTVSGDNTYSVQI